MDPILTFFHGRRRKYVLFWYYKITCPAMVFHQFMEKDEDTLFIRYQKKKKTLFAILPCWLIGAGAAIRIGYLHYVNVEANHSYIKWAYMSMHAAKSVYPVKAMDKPHMPFYMHVLLFDTG